MYVLAIMCTWVLSAIYMHEKHVYVGNYYKLCR